MTKDKRGYLLPETMDPETSRCVLIEVPDDQLHWAAFWGQMDALTKWHNWERDDAKQGKDAAAIWAAVVDAARADWMIGECRLQVRQSTTDPCVLERSYDGGDTWTPWATISDCTSGKDDGPPFAPDPPDAGLDSAANMANWMDALLCMAVDAIDNGDTDAEIITQVGAYIASFAPGAATAVAIQAWIDGLRLLTPAQRADYCGGDMPQDAFDAIICASAVDLDDGGWLENMEDWISDALDGWAQFLIDGFEALAGMLGIGDENYVSRSGGSGGGAGFDLPDCEWEHTFDFAADGKQGWENEASGACSAGAWNGTFFYASYGKETDDNDSKGVRIVISFDNRIITYWEWHYAFLPHSTSNPAARARLTTVPNNISVAWEDMPTGYPLTDNNTGELSVVGMGAELRVAFGTGYTQGEATITKIIVRGLGTDPFI